MFQRKLVDRSYSSDRHGQQKWGAVVVEVSEHKKKTSFSITSSLSKLISHSFLFVTEFGSFESLPRSFSLKTTSAVAAC